MGGSSHLCGCRYDHASHSSNKPSYSRDLDTLGRNECLFRAKACTSSCALCTSATLQPLPNQLQCWRPDTLRLRLMISHTDGRSICMASCLEFSHCALKAKFRQQDGPLLRNQRRLAKQRHAPRKRGKRVSAHIQLSLPTLPLLINPVWDLSMEASGTPASVSRKVRGSEQARPMSRGSTDAPTGPPLVH